MPWNSTFALQQASGPAPAADTARISLRNPRLCFPAARRAELATDAEFVAGVRRNGLTLWDDEELHGVGPNSVAFLTSIEPRGLPLDWRVKLNYVQADYSAGGAIALFAASREIHHGRRRRWIAGACLDAAGRRGAKAARPCSPSWNSRIH